MKEPYIYYYQNGTVVSPNAAGIYANATNCKTATWVNTDITELALIFYIACGLVFAYGMYWTMKRMKFIQEKLAQLVSKREEAPNELTDEEDNFLQYMEGRASKVSMHVFTWIGIAIAAEVAASSILSTATSQKLSVPEADGCSDADNFLTPVEDIFQFFEDGMTVRIGQAMGSGDYATAGVLMKWAALGGFGTGFAGASISTGASYIDQIYSFFVPTVLSSNLPENCPIIPNDEEIQSLARPYWILTAFSWPALFIQKASIGFFIGTGETQLWSIATVIASAIQVGIFLLLIDKMPHTTVYGLSSLIPPYVFIIITFIIFTRPKYLKMFKFKNTKMFSQDGWQISFQAATDGGELLIKDLALTLQKTCSLIMAAHLGLGQQYQLLMYQTVQGIYGYSYGSQNSGSVFPIAIGYSMRLSGSRLLGAKNYKGFINILKAYLIGDLLFGFVAFMAVLIAKDGIPYFYSSDDICQYQEYQCSLSTYDHTFENVGYGMIITGLMCWLNSVFSILQASLYAALDFQFLRNMTLICFFVIYVPAASVSFWVYESPIGLLISYNIPILVLCLVYLWRLFRVIIPNIDEWVTERMGPAAVELRRSLMVNDENEGGVEWSHTETAQEQSIDYNTKTEESAVRGIEPVFDD